MLCVSEYRISREYGGPEEGGWWYDNKTYVATYYWASDDDNRAQDLAALLNDEAKRQKSEYGEKDRFSVIGTPDTVYLVEPQPRELETTERPYYE